MFRVGEFSKLARVSKRLLHHYDELGLLKPARTDPRTGYRYYSARQLSRLNRILALRELGLGLEQIAALLRSAESDEELRRVLVARKAQLEQSLREDARRLRQVEARLREDLQPDAMPEVVVRPMPERQFLAIRTAIPSPAEMLALVREVRCVPFPDAERGAIGPLAAIVHTGSFRVRDNDVELGYLLNRPLADPVRLASGRVLSARELPAVRTMACAIQDGGPDLVFIALGRIGRWIEANGYRMAGPYREIVIASPGTDVSEDWIVEVQMPVEEDPGAPNPAHPTHHATVAATTANDERKAPCDSTSGTR